MFQHTGSRVMARYERKAQFVMGRITHVRSDGSYDVLYDIGVEESHVARNLIVPLGIDDESDKGGNKGGSGSQDKEVAAAFDSLKGRALSAKEQQKQHFLELYARRHEMGKEEVKEEEEEEDVSVRIVGADCESQACGACKLIVDEFGECPSCSVVCCVLIFD